MTGKYILRKDKKSNEYGEYSVYLQYSTMGVGVKKSVDIWVKPEHWLGDNGRTNKFIMTGRDGHPKGDLLNKRLVNIKREYDKVIDDLLKDPNNVITVPVLTNVPSLTDKSPADVIMAAQPMIVPLVIVTFCCTLRIPMP